MYFYTYIYIYIYTYARGGGRVSPSGFAAPASHQSAPPAASVHLFS